jgi:outer membrane receptor protein involved in Fe transport
MSKAARVLLIVGLVCLVAPGLYADVQSAGKIFGEVKAEDGSPLPGATITLTGEQLIASSTVQTSNERGLFRFLNLQPGRYTVTISMQGFASQEIGATVSVGQTASVEATLRLMGTQEQVTVRGEAPLIDKTSPKISTNYAEEKLQQLPVQRNYFEAIDTAPGINDRAGFGAGGNVEGYDIFGFGAATNNYNINGVSVSNIQFGNTWVNPNYDTIEEVQVVGPGASAEYSNYSGAFINIVTKKGTNDFHGGFSAWYTDDKLLANNAGGILDLEHNVTNDNLEASVHLGGPIVKEKLHFFGSAGYFHSESAEPQSIFFDDLRRETYQLRLDFLASPRNTISAMYNLEPIRDEDLGLQIGSGREIGFFRDWESETYYASWQSVLSQSTYGELKYAGVQGHNDRIPNASLDIPSVNDQRTGRQYLSQGFQRRQQNDRGHILANVTHYADEFLKGSHEFKAGIEYEDAKTTQQLRSGGNMFFYIFPYTADTVYLWGIVGYNYNVETNVKRPGAYIQDNITWGRATVNLGLRYDRPETIDDRSGNTMLEFENWSPRLGLSYDITGDGKTVAHGAWGRYYEKVPTYGPAVYAGLGQDPVSYYTVFYPAADLPDPTDWPALRDIIIRPENLSFTFDTQQIPVHPDTKNPRVDVFNAGIERQLGSRMAVSLSYIHREATDFVVLGTLTDLEFTPITVENPLTHEPLQLFARVDPSIPVQFDLRNNDFEYQRTDIAILELRGRPTDKLNLSASLQWENTRGTRENNECGILSLCTNGQHRNPNVTENPWADGHLLMEREWVFKLNGGYQLPWGILFNFDYRYLGGRPWGTVTNCFRIPGCNDPYSRGVLLEPKDARDQGETNLFNVRIGKEFQIGPVTVAALVDVQNVFNEDASNITFVFNNLTDTYAFESGEQGTTVSSYGKPYSLQRPRETRLGLRVVF